MFSSSPSFRSAWILLCASSLGLAAAEQRKHDPDVKPLTPEEQLATFHVPAVFEVQLFAAEVEIAKPLNITFDAAGRLWVTSTEIYPWAARTDALGDPIPGFDKAWEEMASRFKIPKDGYSVTKPPEKGRDTIWVLSDFSPEGRATRVKVFANGLNAPTGIRPLPRAPGAKGESKIPNLGSQTKCGTSTLYWELGVLEGVLEQQAVISGMEGFRGKASDLSLRVEGGGQAVRVRRRGA